MREIDVRFDQAHDVADAFVSTLSRSQRWTWLLNQGVTQHDISAAVRDDDSELDELTRDMAHRIAARCMNEGLHDPDLIRGVLGQFDAEDQPIAEPQYQVADSALIENDVETYLIQQCEAHTWLCWKFTSPSTNGVPDRVVVTPMATVFVELKRPNATPRSLQRVRLAQIRNAGGTAFVIDSCAGVDEFIAIMLRRATRHDYRLAEDTGDGS